MTVALIALAVWLAASIPVALLGGLICKGDGR